MLDHAIDKPLRRWNQTARYRWTDCLPRPANHFAAGNSIHLGVLPGQGIGPEVVSCAVNVLEAVAQTGGMTIELRRGGRENSGSMACWERR